LTTETQPSTPPTDSDWRRFIKNHKAAFSAFVVTALLAVAGAVYVFVWFTGVAQASGLVPSTLDLWSMNSVLLFILNAVFWELVLIGTPAGVGAAIGWFWWKRLPEAEKQRYNRSGKGSKGSKAGGAISPLLFIAFAIKVYVDGYWNTAIASFTLDYVVGSMVTILIWIAVIFAFPAAIAFIWWISRR
jgi:hypothetical protein